MRVLDISDSFETASTPTASTGHIKLGDDGLSVSEVETEFLILENDGSAYIGFRVPVSSVTGLMFNEGTNGDGAYFRYTWTGNTSTSAYSFLANNGSTLMQIFADGDVYIPSGANLEIGATGAQSGFSDELVTTFKSYSSGGSDKQATVASWLDLGGNTAYTGSAPGYTSSSGILRRVGSSNVTDTGLINVNYAQFQVNFSSGTYTNSTGIAAYYADAPNLTGSSALDYAAYQVAASSANLGTNKYGLLIGNQSGSTNNYAIYTGTGESRFGGVVNCTAGLRTIVDTTDVSSPPTDAELDSALGTPSAVGEGFIALLDDNNAGTAGYLVWSDGSNWWYAAGTKAT